MNKLEKLEKMLNTAQQLVEETKEHALEVKEEISIVTDENSSLDSFNELLQRLKTDFHLIRQNLIKLIDAGQSLLSELRTMPVIELKATQLMAIAEIQKSIGQNIRLLIDLYKEISDIEEKQIKARQKQKELELKERGLESKLNVEKAEKVQQNIIFTGTAGDLLKMIKQLESGEIDGN